jgi:preprotein translocase subunit SecA
LEPPALKQLVRTQAEQAYDEKEIEFPVMAGLYHFTMKDAAGHKRYDREKLVEWARERFGVELSIEDLRNKQRHEIHALLLEHSRRATTAARETMQEAHQRLTEVLERHTGGDGRLSRGNGELGSFADWLKRTVQFELTLDKLAQFNPEEIQNRVTDALAERFRPEMRRLERTLLLDILDAAWKDHLLVMDHLRSSIGLRGYAQVDPKVEYKREGMKTFETMWDSVGQRVTDLIYRVEQLNESFIGSTWKESEAKHDSAPSTSEIAQQQQAAIDGTQADHKPEPIRIREARVGRNDPCPCNSGKKYKHCCGRGK